MNYDNFTYSGSLDLLRYAKRNRKFIFLSLLLIQRVGSISFSRLLNSKNICNVYQSCVIYHPRASTPSLSNPHIAIRRNELQQLFNITITNYRLHLSQCKTVASHFILKGRTQSICEACTNNSKNIRTQPYMLYAIIRQLVFLDSSIKRSPLNNCKIRVNL